MLRRRLLLLEEVVIVAVKAESVFRNVQASASAMVDRHTRQSPSSGLVKRQLLVLILSVGSDCSVDRFWNFGRDTL